MEAFAGAKLQVHGRRGVDAVADDSDGRYLRLGVSRFVRILGDLSPAREIAAQHAWLLRPCTPRVATPRTFGPHRAAIPSSDARRA